VHKFLMIFRRRLFEFAMPAMDVVFGEPGGFHNGNPLSFVISLVFFSYGFDLK